MSYLLDRKNKRRKIISILLTLVFLLVLVYFRDGVSKSLSWGSHKLFSPVLTAGTNTLNKFSSLGSYFVSKSSLEKENQNLRQKLNDAQAQMANYISLQAENQTLKETLGRKNETSPFILAAILAKPNQSPYDTLIIDVGTSKGVSEGDIVFARGNIPIGKVAETFSNSAKVVLFSNSGEETQAVLAGKDIFFKLVGRGGGNFEMVIPREMILLKGDQMVLPGIVPYVVANVETILSDPRDPFVKALLISPVNIQELKFVEIAS